MTQKTIIYVLNKKGETLMPTTRCGHVRKLLKEGRAVAVNNCPFTIRLKYDVDDIKQSVYYGIDTGRENIGAGASDEIGNCLHMSQLKTNNKTIKKSMHSRYMYRKERKRHKRIKKQRKAIRNGVTMQSGKDDVVRTKKLCKSKGVSYPGMNKSYTHKVIKGDEAQFNNRIKRNGWLNPSGRQLVQMHIRMLEEARKFLPITHVCLEQVCFDFQKLENENIESWERGLGPLCGFNSYRDYIDEMQEGKCLLCGCNHIDHYHHIKQRKYGGSNNVKNIAGLCELCHTGINGVHKSKETENKLLALKNGLYNKCSISLLNSAMPSLIKAMQEYCSKNGLALVIAKGRQTSRRRKELSLAKKHSIDAYCISLTGRKLHDTSLIYFPSVIYKQQRFKRKSSNNVHKRNHREYYFDGKLVARNRRKMIDQKDNSLKEYMTEYANAHTPQECASHLHELAIRSAQRTYTSHKIGKVAKIKIGDTVRYEKKSKRSKNTQIEIFIATSIRAAENIVRCDTREKAIKFCKRLRSSCIPFIDSHKITSQDIMDKTDIC